MQVSLRFVFALMLLLTALVPQAGTAQAHSDTLRQDYDFDILIRNGRVLDGTGNPWYRADIGIRHHRIVAVGRLDTLRARRHIDATGLYVAPGFIDTHSHAGGALATLELSPAQAILTQGVTTVFINPDGGGRFDIASQSEDLMMHGLGVNVGQLIPHASIRREIIGLDDRAPTTDELQRMQEIVRQGMLEGAFGLSTGPYYPPGSYATTEEFIALSRVVSEFGGVYQSHIRDESDYSIGVEAAVEEVITIAREAWLRGVVTHIKVLGPGVWGQSENIISRIQSARDEGIEVFADQYPYIASATGLSAALVPAWAMDGGREAFLARLEDPDQLENIRAAMSENLARRGGADRIMLRHVSFEESFSGMYLSEIAEKIHLSPIETALEILKKESPGIVSFNMSEADVVRFMQQSWTMTASDGTLEVFGRGVPHPRGYGTFPRKIWAYAMEGRHISLEFAIRSMTGLPATVYNIGKRGYIREGYYADIVIFDPAEIRDLSTFEDPHQYSEGMRYVIVNGRFSIDNGEFLNKLNGTTLVR